MCSNYVACIYLKLNFYFVMIHNIGTFENEIVYVYFQSHRCVYIFWHVYSMCVCVCVCVISKYNLLVKCLLGVRKNTSINLCFVESGIPPPQFVIVIKTKNIPTKETSGL